MTGRIISTIISDLQVLLSLSVMTKTEKKFIPMIKFSEIGGKFDDLILKKLKQKLNIMDLRR